MFTVFFVASLGELVSPLQRSVHASFRRGLSAYCRELETRMVLKFLFRALKGYRLLVLLAIGITILQVGSDICTAFPLKFIPSKIVNGGNDPSCTFPFLNPLLD